MKIVEVSHVIEPDMKTYPGLPAPRRKVLFDHEASRARYNNAAEFLIASLELCGNTGTYLDAPYHRFAGGADLAGLPLERLAHVPAAVVDATDFPGRALGPELFRGLDLADRAVLIRTDCSRHWGTEHYFTLNPFLTAEACAYLLGAGVRFAGIDAMNIDDIEDPSRPAHTKLLGAGVPVCEHMTNLAQVPASGGFLHAAPIAWRGGASFPVRAYVILPDP